MFYLFFSLLLLQHVLICCRLGSVSFLIQNSLFKHYLSLPLWFPYCSLTLFSCDCPLSTSILFFSICIFHTHSLSLSSLPLFVYPLYSTPFRRVCPSRWSLVWHSSRCYCLFVCLFTSHGHLEFISDAFVPQETNRHTDVLFRCLSYYLLSSASPRLQTTQTGTHHYRSFLSQLCVLGKSQTADMWHVRV